LKNTYKIRILDQELSVLSDAEDEQVANVVQFVNNKIEEVLQTKKRSSNPERCHPGSFERFRRIIKIKGN